MIAEDFQLIDDDKIDDSIRKGDFTKIYQQSGANVGAEISNTNFYFGENLNFIHVGNSYLEFDIGVRRANKYNFGEGDVKRLVTNAFA